MPELPEVTTICRSLNRHLPGRIITAAASFGRLRLDVARVELERFCLGQRIVSVTRRAKFLLVAFANRSGLLLHLGMTGSFVITPDDGQPLPYERAYFLLDDGRRWRFCDIRCFGSLQLCPDDIASCTHPSLARLGPEPLTAAFNGTALHRLSRGCRTPVKTWLMDQRKVVGIGNIYANEALFRAGIHPAMPVQALNLSQCRRLVADSKTVLAEAIAAGGTSISDYRDVDGSEGHFRTSLEVYGRVGDPCRRCTKLIERQVQSGRATFFCPQCQPQQRKI